MGENSSIEWTDHTFNPWVGCTKVSPACDHCYAEGWARRTGQSELWTGELRRTSPANWRKPYKWNNEAPLSGQRHRVFCASLADVFDNQAEKHWRADLFAMIRETPNLAWLLLTKRPQNIRKMLPADWGAGWSNAWLGTTAENQDEANRRIPHLLATPAAVRFVSAEPLLEPIDFTKLDTMLFRRAERVNALTGEASGMFGDPAGSLPCLDWIIVGGESGPDFRHLDLAWARSIRDQCAAAGTAFFMKQTAGARKPLPPIPGDLMIRQFPTPPTEPGPGER